jgi:hypothetical protein
VEDEVDFEFQVWRLERTGVPLLFALHMHFLACVAVAPPQAPYYSAIHNKSSVTMKGRKSSLILLCLCIFVSLIIASDWSWECTHTLLKSAPGDGRVPQPMVKSEKVHPP